ncbi:MAG: 2-amino-4-hydroxy-6-hydroxymethyldihydropteridine diphosphokinase [Longimicrobiales bacterium]
MAVAWLGIGTNLGDRGANIERALRELGTAGRVFETSRIYASAPVDHADQPEYWNLAARISTSLPPVDLLARLQGIERRMGRIATFRNGPRLVDIDILFYDDMVMDTPELQLPHPRSMERAFVLRPLAEIALDLKDPRSGRRITDAVSDVAEQIAAPL